jgi:hypothetical protein
MRKKGLEATRKAPRKCRKKPRLITEPYFLTRCKRQLAQKILALLFKSTALIQLSLLLVFISHDKTWQVRYNSHFLDPLPLSSNASFQCIPLICATLLKSPNATLYSKLKSPKIETTVWIKFQSKNKLRISIQYYSSPTRVTRIYCLADNAFYYLRPTTRGPQLLGLRWMVPYFR